MALFSRDPFDVPVRHMDAKGLTTIRLPQQNVLLSAPANDVITHKDAMEGTLIVTGNDSV